MVADTGDGPEHLYRSKHVGNVSVEFLYRQMDYLLDMVPRLPEASEAQWNVETQISNLMDAILRLERGQ